MPVPFLDARSNQCRRPLWDDTKTIGDVCGEPVKPGKSYCPACCDRLFVASSSRPLKVRDPLVSRRTPRAEVEEELTGVFA